MLRTDSDCDSDSDCDGDGDGDCDRFVDFARRRAMLEIYAKIVAMATM
jgi:hypothetical protein